MKADIYNALAALNRGADMQLESLTVLEAEAKLPPEYVEHQKFIVEEARSGVNSHIHSVLGTSESGDWARFQQSRLETEERLKKSQHL